MKTIVEIFQCECGRNIIILTENLENEDIDSDSIECPVCGCEMVSSMTREIEINNLSVKRG